MGATTWSYPKDKVSMEEAVKILTAVRGGFRFAYEGYLKKARTFREPPKIGKRWPREGYFLPDAKTFFTEFEARASSDTLRQLIAIGRE